MIINTKAIEELLNSETSAYEIEKQTGVSRVTINEIRKGERDMKNVPLKNLEKLQNYINQEEEKMEYTYVENMGDYTLYVAKNEDKSNQFFDVKIKWHENVTSKTGKVEELLVEKNAWTSIEHTLEEINSDDEYREDLHQYVDELLGI